MDKKTRVFFVVDSIENNEEIFETLEEAQSYFLSVINAGDKGRLYIATVKNAYKEDNNWNYKDLSDTFRIIKIL